MRILWTSAALSALVILVAGCPQLASWEIAEQALAPGSDLDKAEVHREFQKALNRAEKEIIDAPESVRPYVTKAQVQWILGRQPEAIETLHTALERAKPKTEAERERLKLYVMWAYKEAGTPEMLRKGIRFVEGLIKTESMKTVYCYHMGIYYRRLHLLLGEGVYKTEANRWFLMCRELDPEIIAELEGEGLYDPFMD
jgi:hypothetical protein